MTHLSTNVRYRPLTAGVAAWSRSYTTREVARLVELSPRRLREMARQGLVADREGRLGPFHYSFHDLVLLRNVRPLDDDLPKRKIVRWLCNLKRRLPAERPLHTLRFAAWGQRLVVREDQAAWDAETGQVLMDFKAQTSRSQNAAIIRPRFRRDPDDRDVGDTQSVEPNEGSGDIPSVITPIHSADDGRLGNGDDADVEIFYEQACQLENEDPEAARKAYRRALDIDPQHVDCHLNLGRLQHEAGAIEAAAEHYLKASQLRPEDSTASFNLGVAFHDLGSLSEAAQAYERALFRDPSCADAHYNLSLLHRQLGDEVTALRHLKAYRQLIKSVP